MLKRIVDSSEEKFRKEIREELETLFLRIKYIISRDLNYTFCNFICNGKQTKKIIESKMLIQTTELHMKQWKFW